MKKNYKRLTIVFNEDGTVEVDSRIHLKTTEKKESAFVSCAKELINKNEYNASFDNNNESTQDDNEKAGKPKKANKNKYLSIVIAFGLAITSYLLFSLFFKGPKTPSIIEKDNPTVQKLLDMDYGFIETIKQGDTLLFGRYEQDDKASNGAEPIEWIVCKTSESSYITITLISRYILEGNIFDNVPGYTYDIEYIRDHPDMYCSSYATSEIRRYLNSDFYDQAFNKEEKEFLQKIDGDYVTLPSVGDIEFFNSADSRIAQATPYCFHRGVYVYAFAPNNDLNAFYWLKDSADFINETLVVSWSGQIVFDRNNRTNGIRPMIEVCIAKEASQMTKAGIDLAK